MFKNDKIDRITIVILTIALGVVSYIAFNGNKSILSDGAIEMATDTLRAENQRLAVQVIEEKTKIKKYEGIIDSLQSLKPKINTIYESKYKKIDSEGANAIVSEFNGIFSNNNIK